MSDPWRYACPDGHRSLENRVDGQAYCTICQKRVDVIDLKTDRVVA